VRDWWQYPELRWVNRLDWVPLVALAAAVWGLGAYLEHAAPQLGTNGPQMFVWGWLISTIVLYHTTYTINSVAHQLGTQRFSTDDDSRNNFWLAILTLGEGWHNNHHHYPGSARQGFYWWEIDLSFYLLKLMSWCGLIWDLKPVPDRIRRARRVQAAT
ncbi:MAG: fatty acid desaturase, partial [Wenzhouxiangella sp.]